MPSAQYLLPVPRTSPNPGPYAISVNSTIRLGEKCNPEPALGPEAAAAVASISTHLRLGVAHPTPQYLLSRKQVSPNTCPYVYSREYCQWIG